MAVDGRVDVERYLYIATRLIKCRQGPQKKSIDFLWNRYFLLRHNVHLALHEWGISITI